MGTKAVQALINVHAAKTNLSRLLEDAMNGEEVIIAKADKPMVRLVPVETFTEPRKPGSMKGKLKMKEDFDAPLPPEIAEAFGIQ